MSFLLSGSVDQNMPSLSWIKADNSLEPNTDHHFYQCAEAKKIKLSN